MNIFILDENIDKCAEAHVDKHIVKMPLEAAQMLCTNHWITKYLGHIPVSVFIIECERIAEKPLIIIKTNPSPNSTRVVVHSR